MAVPPCHRGIATHCLMGMERYPDGAKLVVAFDLPFPAALAVGRCVDNPLSLCSIGQVIHSLK